MTGADKDQFPAIEGAPYERYLLDLMRGYAAEQERMDPDLTPLIREIQRLKNRAQPNTATKLMKSEKAQEALVVIE